MKKIITSAAVAAALASAVVAGTGTLTYNGSSIKISKELLTLQKVDINLTEKIIYKCGIDKASASEPSFELKFEKGVVVKAASSDLVIQDDENNTIANYNLHTVNPDGTTSVIFETASSAAITRGANYKIVTDGTDGIGAGDLTLTLPKGTESSAAQFLVVDNSGVTTLETVDATIVVTKQQFSASIVQKLSAQIDATEDFEYFFDGAGATAVNSGEDDYKIDYVNIGEDLDLALDATSVSVVVFADQNLTSYDAYTYEYSSFLTATNDNNITTTIAGNEEDVNQTVWAMVSIGGEPMSITNFTAKVDVAYAGGTLNLIANGTEMGKWDVYGYNAQIPNVAGLVGKIDTTLKFTNTTTVDADIYLTLLDPDGTEVKLNSIDNTELDKLAKGTTGTYKAITLATLATAKNPAFDATTSFSIEISIPATPEGIYGSASFKNLTLGQFKDLPIYSTSSMTY